MIFHDGIDLPHIGSYWQKAVIDVIILLASYGI